MAHSVTIVILHALPIAIAYDNVLLGYQFDEWPRLLGDFLAWGGRGRFPDKWSRRRISEPLGNRRRGFALCDAGLYQHSAFDRQFGAFAVLFGHIFTPFGMPGRKGK